jgi:membrane associated rhomboid family serine protease
LPTPPDESRRSEPAFNLPTVVVGLIVVMIGLHAAQQYVFSQDINTVIAVFGPFAPVRYFAPLGASVVNTISMFTSLVTYALLHASWTHVIVNCVWLAVFGAPLAARIGTSRFLAFLAITSAIAALTHFALNTSSLLPLVGASGAVSAMTAAAARFGFRVRDGNTGFTGMPASLRQLLTDRTSLVFIAVWFGINAVTSLGAFSPGAPGNLISWEAHAGGFISGLLLLPLFDRRVPRYRQ